MANKYSLRLFFKIISLIGTPFFYMLALLYLFKINKSLAMDIIPILVLTEIVCGSIKYIYPKERPVPMKNKTFIQKYMAGSFPSVHTARITAFSAAILLFYKDNMFVLAALFAIIGVGYSRIYLKKHYLIDVVAGFLIGATISALLSTQELEPVWIFALKCVYLMMPGYFANMSPVIFRKINLFVYPIDFNKKINNKPVLGKNKTFRGFVFGIAFAIAIAYLQSLLYPIDFFNKLSFTNYENWLLLGFLMGFGALTGDLAKSFFKRRVGIKPGSKFIPFDQIDFVIGSLLLSSIIFDLTSKIFIVSLLSSFVLDITVNHISFNLKIRDEAW